VFKVSILDQERKLFEDMASQVRLPGTDGEYAVMDFHTPMISLLKSGIIYVDGKHLPIQKGVALANGNKLLVLVER